MVREGTVRVELRHLELHVLVCKEGRLVSKVEVDTLTELRDSLLELLLSVPLIPSILDLRELHVYIAQMDLAGVLNGFV